MSDKLRKLNQPHQDENIDEQEQKRRKRDENEAPTTNAIEAEAKTLTNIYYDCLERIFDFLDLESLLTVADTCKRLQIAAAAKFGDEFSKKRVYLEPHTSPRYPSNILIQHDNVKFFSLKLCLQVLRCFGAKISDLCVLYIYVNASPKGNYLNQYINQYCADTLKSIKFGHFTGSKGQFSNDVFKKPFKNVEKVKIYGGVGDQLKMFVNWFPKLCHLELSGCPVDETTLMNVSFSHLEHLQLYIDHYSHKFCIDYAANILQANPQLQSVMLSFYSGMTLAAVLDTMVANSSITKCKIEVTILSSTINVSKEEINRFAVEHPSMVELVLKGCRLAAVDAIDFIHRMKSLKRIGLQVNDLSEWNRIAQEFNKEWKSSHSHSWYIELNR